MKSKRSLMSPRIVFLDRDGVINRFPGKGEYVTREKELRVLPNALRGIRLLTRAGFRLHVISNQGCVSRGMITLAQLKRMTRNMLKKIRKAGGKIRKVHYCVHQTSDHCRCKKPKTWLLQEAVRGLRLDRKTIFFIGDSREDIQAGHDFGCRTVLVTCGRSKRKDIKSFSVKPDFIKKDLHEAAKWILKRKY